MSRQNMHLISESLWHIEILHKWIGNQNSGMINKGGGGWLSINREIYNNI